MSPKYLATIAAVAPDQRCLVVFIAPAPAPCSLPFLFLNLFFLSSFKTTTTPSSSFPSNAVSSDLLASFPSNPVDSLTKPSLPFTDKLTDKGPSPPAPPHLIRPNGAAFPRERHHLTVGAAAESEAQGSRTKGSTPEKRARSDGSSVKRMRGRMEAWKRTSKPRIAMRWKPQKGSYGVRRGFPDQGFKLVERMKRENMGLESDGRIREDEEERVGGGDILSG
ncbi:hypothetical protein BHE74_00017735 [Ensete ventricosum]|uniref:Uncharacterized protein n=1 Tax=Ensete ventricosum TaxID=4639 RepID=A0A426ZQA4_ENSVE|nr:hypothetical protein B296_00033915 [Ensete ventricosum]RWW74325.1 hypothetical protein BHE74_00017735 [Ensete ventricosum]